ncbi:MAG: hypothetical protein E6Q43_05575 [Dokdonella sp.]|nr:MAG: hypothetical protein E6Q43_05575 [Dokdonella sp.]
MVNAALKHEVEAIMQRLPESATLDDLLLAIQSQVTPHDEVQEMLAQERDPDSPLRQALNRALKQSDTEVGVEHETIKQRYCGG